MSNFVEWSPIYSVSNSALDVQHKQILKLMNDLHSVISRTSNKETIKKAIIRIRIILETHLRYEETLMKYALFPEYDTHRQIHRALLIKTSVMFDSQKNKSVSVMEILTFLKKWWLRHIILDDMKYIEAVSTLEL